MRLRPLLLCLPSVALLALGCDAPRNTGTFFDPDASLKKDDVPTAPDDAAVTPTDLGASPDIATPPTDVSLPDVSTPDASAPDVFMGNDVPTAPTDTGPVCDPGRSLCAGMCVDTSTEPTHCGACGRACEGGQRCELGACVTACESPRQRCGGRVRRPAG